MISLADVLFGRLIDDAGLFPPARKPMERALADHADARASDLSWMFGRFLCPVSRLAEIPSGAVGADWRLGAVLDGEDTAADLATVAAWSGGGRIDLVEARLPADRAPLDAARRFADAAVGLPAAGVVDAFLEVPAGRPPADVRAAVDAIANVRRERGLPIGAKLRCGGVAADAFPTTPVVAAFVNACRGAGLPFKATAGLHHPERTYDEDIGVLQHGFLNLIAAAALPGVYADAIVAEDEPGAFALSADGLAWRDHLAGGATLREARRLLTAFGSCSLDEPVGDLRALGMLDRSAGARV